MTNKSPTPRVPQTLPAENENDEKSPLTMTTPAAAGPAFDPEARPDNVMLAFNHVNVATVVPPEAIINDVCGFVLKGGVTAIMGPSPSGKTLLMKALAGRASELNVSGECSLDGQAFNVADAKRRPFGFVLQEDVLIGELTVRETFEVSARLRCDLTKEQIATDVQRVIDGLGLSHVADNVIGTVMKRGLSGGEKRRVSVGVELVARPKVLFLDEPTSGLDAASAYKVIQVIRNLAHNSGGQIACVLTIHQPNSRIIELFDHLLLLSRGQSVFFGTVPEAKTFFADTGFVVPDDSTPTDYYLHITDDTFKRLDGDFNFHTAYAAWPRAVEYDDVMKKSMSVADMEALHLGGKGADFATSLWTQFAVLLWRNFAVARRDVTLYYLQFVLASVYGFLVGVFFWDLPSRIDNRINDVTNGLVWLVFVVTFINVFKVYYLMSSNRRFQHEKANGSYHVLPYWAAEMVATFVCSFVTFMPAVTIGYFCMGMPAEQFGLSLAFFFVAASTAESLCAFVTQFPKEDAYAVVLAQGALVILCVFAGGSFIRWSEVPIGWEWLSEVSLYTHSTRGVIMHVYESVTYECSDALNQITNKQCIGQFGTFTCESVSDDGKLCSINGIKFLDEHKSLTTDKYTSFALCIFFLVLLKAAIYLLYCCTPQRLMQRFSHFFHKQTGDAITNLVRQVSLLQQRVDVLTYETHQQVVPKLKDTHVAIERSASQATLKPTQLVWEGLTLRLKSNDKVLCDDLTGRAVGGRVLALMGPSGAGKTTMLNALSARATYARITGKVEYNGRAMTREDLVFVPQFDSLNNSFTIREALVAMGKLKVGDEDVNKRVSELIQILGLADTADVRIGELSGGEKKRVSIGLALISKPAVLFLDEPTTGLDSSTAHSTVEYITKIARFTQVVCIMTIHQPSSQIFDMLDDLLLLSKGQTAFFGLRRDALGYFRGLGFAPPAGVNPADHYLDLTNEASGGDKVDNKTWGQCWVDHVKTNPLAAFNAAPVAEAARQQPSELFRLRTLVAKNSVYYYREPAVYYYRLYELLVIAVFAGTLFYRLERTTDAVGEFGGMIFFSFWSVLFSVVAATPELVKDRLTIVNEYLNGAYSLSSHCLGVFWAGLPFNVASAVAFEAIAHFLSGLNDSFEAFVYMTLVTLALLLVMEGIVMCVVEGLKDAMLSTTFSMVMLGMLFLCPGFFVQTDDMVPAVRWMSYMVPTRYAFNGALNAVLSGETFRAPNNSTRSGDQILVSVFSQNLDDDKWLNLVFVLCYALFFRILHFGMLKFNFRAYER